MHWLKPITLENEWVKLIPLQLEHQSALLNAASIGKLSEIWFTTIPNEQSIAAYIQKAMDENEMDWALAFVVWDKKTEKIVGSTRYCNAVSAHRRLEIGYTWYAEDVQKTAVNTACKFLLLQYAFENLNCIAVEFRTNFYNFKSRAAIARLGAKQDGILRNHQILPDGALRDTVVFSIIASEWLACKKHLEYKLKR